MSCTIALIPEHQEQRKPWARPTYGTVANGREGRLCDRFTQAQVVYPRLICALVLPTTPNRCTELFILDFPATIELV